MSKSAKSAKLTKRAALRVTTPAPKRTPLVPVFCDPHAQYQMRFFTEQALRDAYIVRRIRSYDEILREASHQSQHRLPVLDAINDVIRHLVTDEMLVDDSGADPHLGRRRYTDDAAPAYGATGIRPITFEAETEGHLFYLAFHAGHADRPAEINRYVVLDREGHITMSNRPERPDA